MTPRVLFEGLWQRGDALATLYESLVSIGVPQARADELLRAEWVARLAALDLYVHELVAGRMVSQFEGQLPAAAGFSKFKVSAETLRRVASAQTAAERTAAFDLDVRAQLALVTFQMPDKIADGVRFTSDVRLWEAVASNQNPTAPKGQIKQLQKDLKTTLSAIVERRNKIAHEGDLKPSIPREPYAIDVDQLVLVRTFILSLVDSIEAVVAVDQSPQAEEEQPSEEGPIDGNSSEENSPEQVDAQPAPSDSGGAT